MQKNGPLLVIAGAGTGKTSVITRRIAWLVAQKIAKPCEILALTFTDKAADEMEARVDLLLPYGYIDVAIATFHAFGDRVLRDHALELGLRPDYKVLSQADQQIFFREHLFEFPLKRYKSLGDPTKHVQALLGVISRARDEDVSPEKYLVWAKKQTGDPQQLEIARVYKKYQALKIKHGLIDFGDQVAYALQLSRQNKGVLRELQKRYKYILVDEFQDTNYAQFALLKLLAGKQANITVVGDDDQSIYKFRGAAISNILGFEKTYPRCRKVVLTQNYRSTQLILDTAHRLIRHNDPERLEIKAKIDKQLVAASGEVGRRVEQQHFDRVTSEADWVARLIKVKVEAKEYRYQDFAILVRANADAEPFRQALNLLQIPHQFSGGGGLYGLPEIKLVVSFLRSLGDLTDSAALFSLALTEPYGLQALELQKISAYANRRNLTLHHVFAHLDEFDILADIKPESRATVRQIMSDIAYYLEFAKSRTTGEVLYQFLKKSGYLAGLTAAQTPDNERRIRNIARFFERAREFNQLAQNDRVAEFVKYLDLLKEAGDDPESAQPDFDAEAVNVMTIHKAKGLEFPVVFLVALVNEKFPVRSRKAPIELPLALVKEEVPAGDQHLSEERRLFYVGLTRAKQELYLTSAVDYGGKRDRKISQFVLEALDLPKVDRKLLKKPALDQIELFAPAEPAIPAERPRSAAEIIALSPYQIEDYLTCPLKYKYVHLLRVPLLPNQAIIYGKALHQAVQAYFTAKKGRRRFTLKNLLETFAHHWSPEGFISRAHEEQRFAAGQAALRRFYRTEKSRGRQPLYIEHEFTLLERQVQIKGRIDLVEELKVKSLPAGQAGKKSKVIIVDFKSSEVTDQKKADSKVRESLQLDIYALAWQQLTGKLPDALELYFLDSGLVGSLAPSAQDSVKTWTKIARVADGIRVGDYRATPDKRKCGYCAYSEICPSSAV
ncbi:MAG: ATP-dependent helicase [Candidatus Margulisbacteria bacterium]|nr:ATP-dependent helicase [Candidatus Margulisiibacteriota bacterium]